MPLSDAVSTVLSRNAFYRDGYRLLLRISLIQGLIIVLLVATIVAMVLSMDVKNVYFATSPDGRIISMVPLNLPYRTRGEVVTWAVRKSQDVMRFGYNDYRQRLQDASVNFTEKGWQDFTKAMTEARIYEAVEARRLTVSMEPGGAPEVIDQRVFNGVYSWMLQFPVEIKFDGPEAPANIRANLILQIVRVSTLNNPDGISIQQWIAKPR